MDTVTARPKDAYRWSWSPTNSVIVLHSLQGHFNLTSWSFFAEVDALDRGISVIVSSHIQQVHTMACAYAGRHISVFWSIL